MRAQEPIDLPAHTPVPLPPSPPTPSIPCYIPPRPRAAPSEPPTRRHSTHQPWPATPRSHWRSCCSQVGRVVVQGLGECLGAQTCGGIAPRDLRDQAHPALESSRTAAGPPTALFGTYCVVGGLWEGVVGCWHRVASMSDCLQTPPLTHTHLRTPAPAATAAQARELLATTYKSPYDAAVKAKFTILAAAIDAAGLKHTFSDAHLDVTVFAPTGGWVGGCCCGWLGGWVGGWVGGSAAVGGWVLLGCGWSCGGAAYRGPQPTPPTPRRRGLCRPAQGHRPVRRGAAEAEEVPGGGAGLPRRPRPRQVLCGAHGGRGGVLEGVLEGSPASASHVARECTASPLHHPCRLTHTHHHPLHPLQLKSYQKVPTWLDTDSLVVRKKGKAVTVETNLKEKAKVVAADIKAGSSIIHVVDKVREHGGGGGLDACARARLWGSCRNAPTHPRPALSIPPCRCCSPSRWCGSCPSC